MKIHIFTVLLAGTALWIVTPGCDEETEDTRAGAGEACTDGSECQTGLMCFVEVDGQPGECTAIPDGCGNDPACTGSCFDDFENANCPNGTSSCIHIGASVTLTCS
ncbi:MAG: hypothetical protein U0271_35785 [Polyangiaceae bacterium]